MFSLIIVVSFIVYAIMFFLYFQASVIATIILTMPNKNKNKSNSYSVFVNAMRPQVEAETGKRMTFDEISEYVGPKWKVSTVNYYFSCITAL